MKSSSDVLLGKTAPSQAVIKRIDTGPYTISCICIQPSSCPRLWHVSISFPHGTLDAAVQLTVHSNWRTPDIPHVLLSKNSIVYRAIDEFYQRSCTVSSLEGSLLDLLLRTSNEGWFISSIWFVWLVWLIGLEIHPKEPDRPANQTDEPERVARAQKIISLHPLWSFHVCSCSLPWNDPHVGLRAVVEQSMAPGTLSAANTVWAIIALAGIHSSQPHALNPHYS